MRKSFFAGLITLLPIVITYIILSFGVNLVTGPFEFIVAFLLKKLHILNDGFAGFTHEQVISFLSKIFIIFDLFGLILLVGFFASKINLNPLGHYFDQILMKIPLVRHIYGPSKELVNVFFNPQDTSNRQTVLVPYPSPKEKTIGIVTGEFTADLKGGEKNYLSVFIPSTPNATNGYLCAFERQEATLLDLPADVALKSIMSFTIVVKE